MPPSWPERGRRTPSSPCSRRNGQHLAVSDAEHTWLVNLADLRVARGRSHVAIALGISPDERRLWLVGERGRVSALPLPWVR